MALLPSVLAGAFGFLLLTRVVPRVRIWTYLLGIVFLYADAGWSYVVENLDEKWRRLINPGLAISVAVAGLVLMMNRSIEKYPDTGVFPEAEALIVALQPYVRSGDILVAACPADAPLHYYAIRHGVPIQYFGDTRSSTGRQFIVQQGSLNAAKPGDATPVVCSE